MSETYCGKSCDGCSWKEELRCPGCRTVFGYGEAETCEILLCCRKNRFSSCGPCGFFSNCVRRGQREKIPEFRLQRQREAAEQQAKANRKSAFLAPRLEALFWLLVIQVVTGFLSWEPLASRIWFLEPLSLLLPAVCTVAYCLLLLKLSREEDCYRFAGICGLLAFLLDLAAGLPLGEPAVIMLVQLPGLVLSLVGLYYELRGHWEVLEPLDAYLSLKWRSLWRWNLICLAGILCIMVVNAFSFSLGQLLLVANLLAALALGLFKLVYLRRTARLFRSLAQTKPDPTRS